MGGTDIQTRLVKARSDTPAEQLVGPDMLKFEEQLSSIRAAREDREVRVKKLESQVAAETASIQPGYAAFTSSGITSAQIMKGFGRSCQRSPERSRWVPTATPGTPSTTLPAESEDPMHRIMGASRSPTGSGLTHPSNAAKVYRAMALVEDDTNSMTSQTSSEVG